MEKEIWKDVVGYEGLYQVSNFGNVRSVDRTYKHYKKGNTFLKGKNKSQSNSLGYLIVGLSKNGKPKNIKVHRLVALSFIENPESKPFVNHIDGVKTNNHVSNLEWATASENSSHAFSIGLHKGSHYGLKGSRNPNSKKVSQYSENNVLINTFSSITEAYEDTGVHAQNISFACNDKYKKAGGFIWKYKT